MRERPFAQVDVFASTSYSGNPVGVVLDAADLPDDDMLRFARWTNLSETTFVSAPTQTGADYRVRIFTPEGELPFAGHPTLGTCHAWLQANDRMAGRTIVQQCGAGLVEVRPIPGGFAFAAPPAQRSGPVSPDVRDAIANALGVDGDAIREMRWADNGPGWVGVRLRSVDEVLSVAPGYVDQPFGVFALYPPGSEAALEVRAFFPTNGVLIEDPVTGSLNASLAAWLIDAGDLAPPYVARQGAALSRAGLVQVSRDADERLWVGGRTGTMITGTARL